MNRRAVLSTVTTSVAVGVAGCNCILGLVDPSERLDYDITLDEISYNRATDQWEGRCSLWLSFSTTASDDSDFGISNAGIAIYGDETHRIGLLEFGDLAWQDVTEANRSDEDCHGYRNGNLTRTSEFEVGEFPEYFGLWYSDIDLHKSGSSEGLEYRGPGSGTDSTELSQWRSLDHPEVPFPQVPTPRPELGQNVENAGLDYYASECSEEYRQPSILEYEDEWDLAVQGALRRIDTQYVPGLERAAIREDEDVLDMIVQMRPFRRPPDLQCESARTEYTAGVDLIDPIPAEIDVTHRDIDGNKITSFRLATG